MSEALKVYVACAIRDVPENNKESFLNYVRRAKSRLKQLGVNVLEFVPPEDVDSTNIYVHDMEQVEQSDMLIVICDYGSIGAGIEFEHAFACNTPILVVSRDSTHKMLSDAAEARDLIFCRSNVSNTSELLLAFRDSLNEFGLLEKFSK